MLIFAALMALYPMAVGFLQARFGRRSPAARAVLVMPVLWVLGEWLRGNLMSGFPWLYLGYSQTDTPLAALLPIIGTLGLSLWLALAVGALVAIVHGAGRARVLPAGVLLALGVCTALARLPVFVAPAGESLNVTLVQHNVSLSEKWQSHNASNIASAYLHESEALSGADLIVWPEAALPTYLDEIAPAFLARLEDHEADFLLGALARDSLEPNAPYYNVAVGIGDQLHI